MMRLFKLFRTKASLLRPPVSKGRRENNRASGKRIRSLPLKRKPRLLSFSSLSQAASDRSTSRNRLKASLKGSKGAGLESESFGEARPGVVRQKKQFFFFKVLSGLNFFDFLFWICLRVADFPLPAKTKKKKLKKTFSIESLTTPFMVLAASSSVLPVAAPPARASS